jgi:nucleotide-binding universal stress UspA family protein
MGPSISDRSSPGTASGAYNRAALKAFRRILHPTDFSAASRPAFERALALARTNRASLTILHVIAPFAPTLGEGYVSPRTWESIEGQVRAQAQSQLAKLVARARKAGGRATSLLVEGPAADRIARAARARRADLVVMGTHGRSGLARLVIGSVAARVVGSAPCPVLTVRARRR